MVNLLFMLVFSASMLSKALMMPITLKKQRAHHIDDSESCLSLAYQYIHFDGCIENFLFV
jgi:hypothetical protein